MEPKRKGRIMYYLNLLQCSSMSDFSRLRSPNQSSILGKYKQYRNLLSSLASKTENLKKNQCWRAGAGIRAFLEGGGASKRNL